MVLVIIGLYLCIGQIALPKEIEEPDTVIRDISSEWTMILPSKERKIIDISEKQDIARGEKLVIETVTPDYVEDNMYICVYSARQDVNVIIDGEQRAAYSTKDTRLFGKSSQVYCVFAKTKQSDRGKILRVELSTDSSYSGSIDRIVYCNKLGVWSNNFLLEGPQVICAVFIAVFSILVIIVSSIFKIIYKKTFPTFYMSVFTLLVSLWLIFNSYFVQLMFPNVSVISDLKFLCVFLMGIPLSIYKNRIQNERYSKYYRAYNFAALTDVLVCTFLHTFKIVDFSDTLISGFILCGCLIVLIAVTTVIDLVKRKAREYLVDMIIMALVITVMLGEFLYFIINPLPEISGMPIAITLLIMSIGAVIVGLYNVYAIEKEKNEAIKLSKTQAKFLANISHEIRTPINTILGMDEIILRESDEEMTLEYASDIQIAGTNLLSMINNLLDISKIRENKMELIVEKYSLTSLISECYNLNNTRVRAKGLELLVKNDPNVPENLMGDVGKIKQIITNLLTNAIKYTDEGTITLNIFGERISDKDYLLKISIEDTGRGISEEALPTLFDEFSRADIKKNRTIEGTGLGLAICNQYALLMKGNIDVKSKYGKGSSFTLNIPQQIAGEWTMGVFDITGKIKPAKKFANALETGNAKILVVDDVEMNLKVFTGLLRNSDLRIETATSGKGCIEKTRETKYDLVFIDDMMPEMDGVETFRQIKKDDENLNRETPFIMLTANAIVGAREKYLETGFSDYLSKPFKPEKLDEMIKTHIVERKNNAE